ncbi:MAG TPA: alkaline phosphatase D family protein [Thermodesulfobacteriota bacterium]|nr:alkaline phosphatase D family protein [Thermodesulfobacteriota bacterium]
MAKLILGPLLRYVGSNDATIWVETDAPCEVEVLGHCSRTFQVEDHHYALVHVTDLTPGTSHEYGVMLDGDPVWPDPNSVFPPSVIRTHDPHKPFKLVFGSCRVGLPHEPPYTLPKEKHKCGRGIDALYALALWMRFKSIDDWPHALLFLGDQVYADDVSPGTLEFIRSRRSTKEPPGEEIADFEEYTRLYWETWCSPAIRWLLSTVPSAMIFDDHDVCDDWNISESWVEEMRAKPWWDERIISGFMSYWLYQHLGNLSPRELEEDEIYRQVRQAEDAGPILRKFAFQVDRNPEIYRWSFYRDFGKIRLIVMDSRAARVLKSKHRAMIDEEEWDWIGQHARGDFDHLLLGTSLPVLVGPGIHYIEAWNEAICDGVWGTLAAKAGEKIRRFLDLEHWSAFQKSFTQVIELLHSIGRGERGRPPATIVILSGDVHHAYLAEASFPHNNTEVRSTIYQSVCSPFRNCLGTIERKAMRACWSKTGRFISKALAGMAGIKDPDIQWNLVHDKPWFDNQVSTLEIEGHKAILKIEKTAPDNDNEKLRLEKVFEHLLSKG